jgi:hypothetical protein
MAGEDHVLRKKSLAELWAEVGGAWSSPIIMLHKGLCCIRVLVALNILPFGTLPAVLH